MKKNLGYCGLDCEKCDAYLATIHNDDELRAKMAKLWSELNGVEILPEMINCEGCRVDGTKTYFCENLCSIRKCALVKGCETCGDCTETDKCQTLGEFLTNNPQALDNLKNK